MSTRLVYQQCVDECGAIQAVVSSFYGLKVQKLSAAEQRKRLFELQSEGRSHLSALKSYINQFEEALGACSSGENRRKLNAIDNQYASILESYRTAVYNATSGVESLERNALFAGTENNSRGVAVSGPDTQKQMKASMKLTADMRVHARLLAEEVARGNLNAEFVDTSSNQFESNLQGLNDMKGQLKGSSRLAGQLSQRRVMDCFLFTIVFVFFYLICANIVLKRLYLYQLIGF